VASSLGSGPVLSSDVATALEWKVRPENAHKRDTRNLWLSTATIDEQGAFSVGFRIPTSHGPVRIVDLMEVERQAGIVFSHRCLGVADDSVFVLSGISLELVSAKDWRRKAGLVGEANVSVVGRSPRPREASIQFTLRAGPRLLALGGATVSFLTPGLYDRLRRSSLRVQADRSGASSPDLIETDTASVDLADRLVSDHAVDHVPGMALAAAIERAIMAAASGGDLRMLSINFTQYVEYHSTVSVNIDDRLSGQLCGRVCQGGVVKATFSALWVERRR
jgi:2-oxo-3-(phosphooxy)propyl 3-oxoalkanoate synthase